MNDKRARFLLTVASYLTLVSLLLMVWGFLGKGPIPIFVSMTVGQVIGTGAFIMYLMVVVPELWRLGDADRGMSGESQDAGGGDDDPSPTTPEKDAAA